MDQLLTTKLHIPETGINLVQRPQLYERLDESLRRKLTLVSAPTGFGKSTLVAGWLFERDQPAAWLSLDQGDNDPVRFWTYLIAAVQSIQPETGEEARQIISATQFRSAESVVISLINEISQLGQDLIIVLDDYHIIEERGVHGGLSYLLDYQPPNLHMVLVTRIDPPISLARLRAHNQLVEIRAVDLQFTTKEAAILLNDKMGLNLKPEQIEALNTHTESWAVGLQLAALSLKARRSRQGQPAYAYDTFIKEFTEGHQFILDYLTEEVLISLPDAEREFLLHTSILERFCDDLCQAVTGDPSSQRLLDMIRKRNLFLIPLDTSGRWFRYQHLFAQVLYALLERDHPDEISNLHLKAAAWFDNENYPYEAVDHALGSDDMTRARELVLKHWMPVLHRGEVATVLRWLDALPDSSDGADPYVPLARCWALFLSWQYSAIEPHLDQASTAYERLEAESSIRGAQRDQVAAQLEMMRSVLARDQGDHASSVAHAEEAARLMPVELLEGIGTSWNMLAAARAGAGDFSGAIEAYEQGVALAYAEGNLIGAYGCIYGQAMYMLVQGRLNQAEELCRRAIDRAVSEGHGDFPATASLHMAMARIELERNQLDQAWAHLSAGLSTARPGGFTEAERTGRYIRAQVLAARGDQDAAMDVLRDTERILDAMDDPYLTGELNWQWAAHFVGAGDLDAARKRLCILEEKIALTQHANLLLWHRWLHPRLLCAEGRYAEALEVLDEYLVYARRMSNNGELILLLALQALALAATGDYLAARAPLREALTLGAPGGYVRRWLDAGPGIEPLLRDFRADRGTSPASFPYLDALLDACRATFEESTSSKPETPPHPLTPRELEIMRLICRGYSNPEIADELVVSVNTIKKHTSNIYGKLGVRGRTQAIARAHELRLL